MARGLEGGRVYFADPALRAHDVGERESVPVAIGVFGFMQGGIGVDGSPVAAVVGGDVSAVGAYSNPRFAGGVVSNGGAVAVRRGLRGEPMSSEVDCEGSGSSCRIGMSIVPADSNKSDSVGL